MKVSKSAEHLSVPEAQKEAAFSKILCGSLGCQESLMGIWYTVPDMLKTPKG